ncbi:hypothetical protein D3C71_1266090 [compost metagenome]
MQPLAASINISPQGVIFHLRIAHSSIRGPFGLRVPFVDIAHLGIPPLHDLACLAL